MKNVDLGRFLGETSCNRDHRNDSKAFKSIYVSVYMACFLYFFGFYPPHMDDNNENRHLYPYMVV